MDDGRGTTDERGSTDGRKLLDEWRYWLVGAIVMTAIWGFMSFRQGHAVFYWPSFALGVWALILLLAPLLPRRGGGRD